MIRTVSRITVAFVWFNTIGTWTRTSDKRFVFVAGGAITVIWTRSIVAVISVWHCPVTITVSTDVHSVLITWPTKFVVEAILGIAIVAVWFYPVVAWPRSANVGLEIVAGTLVRIVVASGEEIDHNDDCRNANDDSCDWQCNRNIAKFSCTWRVRHRATACHSCTNTHKSGTTGYCQA